MKKKSPIQYQAEVFKLLGGETRLRIVHHLINTNPRNVFSHAPNVSHIAKKLKMTHSAVSHQLGLMREAGVVTDTRLGRDIHYMLGDRLADSALEEIISHVK